MPIASISSNLIEEGRHGQEVLGTPAHASGSLRQHVLPRGMSVFAKALGVLRQLHRVLAETAPIAERWRCVGKFCDNGPELWLRCSSPMTCGTPGKKWRARSFTSQPRRQPEMPARASECLNGDGR
jgi:hypothetical protein